MSDKPTETSIRHILALPFTLLLPLVIIRAYQLIPPPVRGAAFPGPSTSQRAYDEALATGRAWHAIRKAIRIRW